MLDMKERLQAAGTPRSAAPPRDIADQGRPEMVIVIGLVAIISVAFGFVLGLMF